MKIVIGSLLFVFFSMIAEDALFAHAGAEDLTSCYREHCLSDSEPDNDPTNSSAHRDICHFGHCSFLLIEPLQANEFIVLPKVSFTPYLFSFTGRWLEPSIRPPIT